MTARLLVALPAFTALLMGTSGVVDEPALLAGLLGAALLLLGSARAARRVVVAIGAPTPRIGGPLRGRETTAVARQCDPDGAGRMRARAPAGAPQAV